MRFWKRQRSDNPDRRTSREQLIKMCGFALEGMKGGIVMFTGLIETVGTDGDNSSPRKIPPDIRRAGGLDGFDEERALPSMGFA